MARTKQTSRKSKRNCAMKKKREEAWADYIKLEVDGELSPMMISWKNRCSELRGLLAGKSWELVKDLRNESKFALVCPVCTLEMEVRGRPAPSIVPCHLFPVHLERIHQVEEDLRLTCPTCKTVPGLEGVSKVENHFGHDHGQCGLSGKVMSKRELLKAVTQLQTWNIEKKTPGEAMVACPVCKVEAREKMRVHESMVRANYFRNHVKLEHKQLQYSCFLKASVFECPVCQEMVPPGMLETHFAEGRTCEKALPINHVEVCVKEEDVKMEHDVESWVKKEYVEADKEIKIESGVIIKQEAIEEFYEEGPDGEALSLSQERPLKRTPAESPKNDQDVFHVRELPDQQRKEIIKKYVQTNQPVVLLKRLTRHTFYKYSNNPKGRHKTWKCWITSSSGITICAWGWKKKEAMRQVAVKALAQLFSVHNFPSDPHYQPPVPDASF